MGRKDLVVGSEQEKSQTSVWTGGSEEFIVGTPAGCVVELSKDGLVKTLQISIFQKHPWNTQEIVARLRAARTQRTKRTTVANRCTSCAALPLPINTEPAKPRRVCIRNSVELARYGYSPG